MPSTILPATAPLDTRALPATKKSSSVHHRRVKTKEIALNTSTATFASVLRALLASTARPTSTSARPSLVRMEALAKTALTNLHAAAQQDTTALYVRTNSIRATRACV